MAKQTPAECDLRGRNFKCILLLKTRTNKTAQTNEQKVRRALCRSYENLTYRTTDSNTTTKVKSVQAHSDYKSQSPFPSKVNSFSWNLDARLVKARILWVYVIFTCRVGRGFKFHIPLSFYFKCKIIRWYSICIWGHYFLVWSSLSIFRSQKDDMENTV